MNDMITEMMADIDQECRDAGYYPDLVELMEMVNVRLNEERLNEQFIPIPF